MSTAKKIKSHPAVAEFWEDVSNRVGERITDSLGRRRYIEHRDYWVYLRDGWTNPVLGCGTIHEKTLRDVWEQLRQCKEVVQ